MSGEWDHVVERLQEWRREAGEPSYGEIAARITAARIAAGSTAEAARTGRTTVYDAFRLGRARINLALVREIAAALGVGQQHVDALVSPDPAPDVPPAPVPVPVVEAVPAPALPVESAAHVEDAAPVPTRPASSGPADWPWRQVLLLMAGCLALNLLGREFVDLLSLPVYFDMVGTAVAAVLLGPWRGAAVGASTNLLGYFFTGPVSVPFAIVNVVGALIWGYGVHRWDMGRTMARFFALCAAVAVACSLVALPILFLLYDGSMGHAQDDLTDSLQALGNRFEVALAAGNLLTSLADKLISGFSALVAASLLGVRIAAEPSRLPRFSSPVHRGATTQ